jgi:hypothetical protein
MPHVGAMKKSSFRIDDTVCARVSAGEVDEEIGVTCEMPTPAAVAPISTTLSWYFEAGILPV